MGKGKKQKDNNETFEKFRPKKKTKKEKFDKNKPWKR